MAVAVGDKSLMEEAKVGESLTRARVLAADADHGASARF